MAISIGGGSGNQIAINGTAGSPGQVIVTDGSNAYWGAPGGTGAVGSTVMGAPPVEANNYDIIYSYSAGWYSVTLYGDSSNSVPTYPIPQNYYGGTWQVHGAAFYMSGLYYIVTATRVA